MILPDIADMYRGVNSTMVPHTLPDSPNGRVRALRQFDVRMPPAERRKTTGSAYSRDPRLTLPTIPNENTSPLVPVATCPYYMMFPQNIAFLKMFSVRRRSPPPCPKVQG